MKNLITGMLIVLIPSVILAQNAPLNSFSNAGGKILKTGGVSPYPAHIGVIGQPIATGYVTGTMVVSTLMYADDLHPPVITYNPALLSLRLGEENTMSFQATDNASIASSKIFYKPIGKIGAFESADITVSPANTFTKIIPPAWYDMMGMEYFIEVTDSENITRHPGGSGRHIVYTTHPLPQIPPTLLSYGTTKNSYRIISLPYITGNSISQIFDELGGSDKARYRIFKYEVSGWKEYPTDFTTIDRADGYFIIMSELLSDVVLSMPEFQSPPNDQSNLYEISLTPGWNLIGNPYTLEINWDDVLAFNDMPAGLASDLKIWTENGQYENAKNLAAYQGAFVWLDGSQPMQVVVSFKGQTSGASGGRISDNKSDSWKINLVLQEGADKNTTAAFGMHTQAKFSFDRFDDLDPPGPDRFVTVRFAHPEHSQQYFLRDIVPNIGKYIWDMQIPSITNNDRLLSWSVPDLASVPSDLLLYDVDGNKVVDMKSENAYSFPSSSQNFKIFYGPAATAEIRPEIINVLSPHPNPITGHHETVFSLGLPKSDDEYTVLLDLFDAAGRAIYRNTWSLGEGLHTIRVPQQTEIPGNAGELVYYRLQIGRYRYTGKLIFKP
jgi:hypothetical protein